ncbi:MAG: phosphate ABC transporter ATP-binding protein [Acidimicrobiia bacterium]|nr:phosphate ABC transporter ATP-binding protein [Acidimicrobiia bacterium]
MAELFRFNTVDVIGSSGVRLENVTLAIPDSGITVLAGPSGSGKSTLLRLCNRLEAPTRGSILYRGRDLAFEDPLELRRQVGMVFQKPVLFAGTVRDNLAEADGDGTGFEEALDRTALDASFLDRPAADLSGGEAQRVCLARALLARPDVLLMDEATSSLDGAAVGRLEGLATALAQDGMPIVWVTHDLDQLRRLADQVAVLLAGTVRFTGAVDELSASDDAGLLRFLEGADA